jgi:hypothetical protein
MIEELYGATRLGQRLGLPMPGLGAWNAESGDRSDVVECNDLPVTERARCGIAPRMGRSNCPHCAAAALAHGTLL